MEPTHPAGVNHKVARCERLRADERENSAIDLWPIWFHQVVDERLPPALTNMQITYGRIERDLGDGNAHLTFEHGVAVVRDRVEGVRWACQA